MFNFNKLKRYKNYLIKTHLEKSTASSCCFLLLNYQLLLFSCACNTASFCNISMVASPPPPPQKKAQLTEIF